MCVGRSTTISYAQRVLLSFKGSGPKVNNKHTPHAGDAPSFPALVNGFIYPRRDTCTAFCWTNLTRASRCGYQVLQTIWRDLSPSIYCLVSSIRHGFTKLVQQTGVFHVLSTRPLIWGREGKTRNCLICADTSTSEFILRGLC